VVIHGKVVGNVTADDRVEITSTGSLQGNIVAARVVLKDNSQFRGSIDTGGDWSTAAPTAASTASSTSWPTGSPTASPAAAAPRAMAAATTTAAAMPAAQPTPDNPQPSGADVAKVGDVKVSKSSLLKALNWGDSQLKK
jgi:hypothetical protein